MGAKSSPGSNPEQPADEAELRRRIDAGPQDPEDYQALAELLYSSGRHEEAKSLLDRTLSLNLDDLERGEILIENASWLYEFDREEEVLELAKTGLGLLPANRGDDLEVAALRARARSLIAFCLWSDEPEAAKEAAHLNLRELEQLWTESPGSDLAAFGYYEATALYYLLDRSEDVIRSAKQCLQIAQDEAKRLHCMFWLGQALQQTGDLVEARHVVHDALQHVEADKSYLPILRLLLGLVDVEAKRWMEAREQLRSAAEALRSDPTFREDKVKTIKRMAEINLLLAESCYELGEYAEAMKACEEIMAAGRTVDPSDYGNALVWIGWCHLELKDYARARKCFEDVLASPVEAAVRKAATEGLESTHFRLGCSFYESEEYGLAAPEFEALLALHPEHDEARCRTILWLGHCRAALGEETRARNCYEVVLASPGATEKQKALARKFLGQDRWLPGFLRKWIQ